MSNAFAYRMPQGIPGAITREGVALVEVQILGAVPVPAFGLPVKMVNGLIAPFSLIGDTNPYGWLVRPYPTTGHNAGDPLGTAVPLRRPGTAVNILICGYLNVLMQANPASAQPGGVLYARYANPSGAAIVGGVEATLIAGTTVPLIHTRLTGTADDAGNVEIYFRARGRSNVDLAGAAAAAAVATGNIP